MQSRLDCNEKNLEIKREQSFSGCRFTAGERIVVRFLHGKPLRDVVVHFLDAQRPELVHAQLEAPVGEDGMARFSVPALSAPPGTEILVQVQEKESVLSGSFRFRWSLLATTLQDDSATFWIWDESPPRPVCNFLNSGNQGFTRAEFSPDGRVLLVSPTPDPGVLPGPAPLLAVSAIAPWAHMELPRTAGGAAFLPAMDAAENPRVVWAQQFPEMGEWQLQIVVMNPDGPGASEALPGFSGFTCPPRILSAPDGIFVVPAACSGQILPDSTAFVHVAPDFSQQYLSCADVFPGEDLVALDVSVHAQGIFVACARLENGGVRVRARWAAWDGRQGQPSAAPDYDFSWCALSGRWHFPVIGANPQAPVFLQADRLAPGFAACPPLLLDPSAGPLPLENVLESGEVLFVDSRTLLLYAPAQESGTDTRLQIFRAPDWEVDEFERELLHAAVFSADQLLLANTSRLIQSTLDDFLAGYPGTTLINDACRFIALNGAYR